MAKEIAQIGLGPHINVDSLYVRITGNLIDASILTYLTRHTGAKPLSLTNTNFAKKLYISPRAFRNSKKRLIDLNIIRVESKGRPPVSHYYINFEALNELRIKDSNSPEVSLHMNLLKKAKWTERSCTVQLEGSHGIDDSENSTCDISQISQLDLTVPIVPFESRRNIYNKLIISLKNNPKYNKEITNKTNNKNTVKLPNQIEKDLAELFLELILQRRPNAFGPKIYIHDSRKKKLDKWANIIRLMHSEDKWTYDEIELVIDWTQKDDFWNDNCRSAEKLRKQMDRLLSTIEKEKRVAGIDNLKMDPFPDITKEIISLYQEYFLGSRAIDWDNKDTNRFIRASQCIHDYAKKYQLQIKNMPGYLMKTVRFNYANKGESVKVGHLCSNYTWDILVPQWLSEVGINYV